MAKVFLWGGVRLGRGVGVLCVGAVTCVCVGVLLVLAASPPATGVDVRCWMLVLLSVSPVLAVCGGDWCVPTSASRVAAVSREP